MTSYIQYRASVFHRKTTLTSLIFTSYVHEEFTSARDAAFVCRVIILEVAPKVVVASIKWLVMQVWQVDLHWGEDSLPGSEHTVGKYGDFLNILKG